MQDTSDHPFLCASVLNQNIKMILSLRSQCLTLTDISNSRAFYAGHNLKFDYKDILGAKLYEDSSSSHITLYTYSHNKHKSRTFQVFPT
jgi:hypothetical protein